MFSGRARASGEEERDAPRPPRLHRCKPLAPRWATSSRHTASCSLALSPPYTRPTRTAATAAHPPTGNALGLRASRASATGGLDKQITNRLPSYHPVCAPSPWYSTRRHHRRPVRRPPPRVRRALSLAPFAALGLRLARSLIALRKSPRLPNRARPSRSWPPQLSSRPRPLPRILTAPGSRSSSTELAVASLIHSSVRTTSSLTRAHSCNRSLTTPAVPLRHSPLRMPWGTPRLRDCVNECSTKH